MNTECQINCVKIVFTASNTYFGRLIRWITQSDTSHVMLQYTSDLWGGEWIAEATVTGVRKVPAEKAKHSVIREYVCKFDAKKMLHSMRDYLGEPYDYQSIAVLGWTLLIYKIFQKKITRPLHNHYGQFCSEFISRGFAGDEDLPKHNWDFTTVSPKEVDTYCKLYPSYFELIDKSEPKEFQNA
jgi:hypothetical protein